MLIYKQKLKVFYISQECSFDFWGYLASLFYHSLPEIFEAVFLNMAEGKM